MEFKGMEMGLPHKMDLMETYDDGSQEWHCPTCGRRFIMHWPPNYHREILNEGDVDAVHTGGTGGVCIGPAEVENTAAQPALPIDDLDFSGMGIALDDPSLSAFARFFDDVSQ